MSKLWPMLAGCFWFVLYAPTKIADGQENALTAFPQLDSGQDWPWWRGPSRNGFASSTARPPTEFGPSENVRWSSPVPGRGHGSPIVVGGRVYLATADESTQTQSVLAYDLVDGQGLWRRDISRGGFPANNHPKNTEASTTLASDGQRLYVTFFHHKSIQLTALDLQGQTVWQKIVGPFDPRRYEYGYAPSPLIYKNLVIVAAEHDGDSSIAAFDRLRGTQQWRIPRPSNITFSSPVVAHVAGRDQLLISGSDKVCSYDPAAGQPLWETPGTTAATCGTMVWSGDLVIASGGYPKAETLAVKADGSGEVVWRNRQKCYEQSMLVVDGYLYGLTDRGILYCWRVSDGREMWRQRLAGPVSASPVLAGGHIYWANEAGIMYVLRPNPERFELVAENRLGNEAFASPAISGDLMLLRVAQRSSTARQENLVCIGP